jgi:transposase-like protein
MTPTPDLQTRDILDAIREARFIHGVTCVRCHARCVQRWGTFAGRQRYRCGSCLRTFSDLTGTAASYLKKVNRLVAYVRLMPEARSVRCDGRRMGIDKDTALRWRHRLLHNAPQHSELITVGLAGIVEVVESRFNCVRRPRARWWDVERVAPATVVVMRDRRRLTYQERSGTRRFFAADYECAFAMLRDPATVVSTVGPVGSAACAVTRARRRGRDLFYRTAAPAGRLSGRLHHARGVIEFVLREKRWLRRFRGVSARWLRIYLFWFEMVDPLTRAPDFAELLMWPVFVD